MLQYVLYVKSVGDGYRDSDEASINVSFSAGGDNVYTLVTDASTLAVGDKVIIVAAGYDVAMSTTQNDNNRGQADIEKKDNTIDITDKDTVQVFTLEKGTKTGTFAFNTGSGYIYAASSKNNYLRTATTLSDNSSWKITITSGATTITAQGTNTRNILRYNDAAANNGKLFSCYNSGQKAVQIYKK